MECMDRMDLRRRPGGTRRAAFAAVLAVAIAALAALAAFAAPAGTAPGAAGSEAADSIVVLVELGRHSHGVFAQGGAEIAAYDKASRRLFVVDGRPDAPGLDLLDVSDPAAPRLLRRIAIRDSAGGPANSVAAKNGVIAVAVENGADPQAPGCVHFLDGDGRFLGRVVVGARPDMLAFTPDGRSVLVVNEGEPSPDYARDPEGSVSVIDLSRGAAVATARTIGFEDFDAGGPRHGELPAGVRIFGPKASVSRDLEPEYVAIAPDGRKAWVALQENNAIAILDLEALRVETIVAMGAKDHRKEGQGLDPSDADGGIRIRAWPVFGLYQPDAIAAFAARGRTWIVAANEGDTRRYPGFDEVVRVADLRLDPARFPDAAALQRPEALGRLRVSRVSGDLDGDGDFDELHAFGARSVAILDEAGRVAWDSGELLERLVAIDDSASARSADERSDDQGSQPEGVAVGAVGGRVCAFIGLERMNGVVVLDVSDPVAPTLQWYTGEGAAKLEAGAANPPHGGDEGPEGVLFVAASDSPTGRPMLVVCNEVSGTTTLFDVVVAPLRR